MSRRLNCKSCGRELWVNSKTFNAKLAKYYTDDATTLRHEYICAKCKSLEFRLNKKNRQLRETEPYKIVVGYCKKCYYKAYTQKFTPKALNEMRYSIHNKLTEYNITNYEYIVYQGIVRGIKLNKLPFFGTVEVSLI